MRCFNDFHNTKLQIYNMQILFNSFEGSCFSQLSNPHKGRLRLLISLQKKYLYTCKKLTKKPDSEELVSKNSIVLKIVACCEETTRLTGRQFFFSHFLFFNNMYTLIMKNTVTLVF